MLPRGRPPGPGTAEEKAAIRREKVRLNVKAYRERKRLASAASSSSQPSPADQSSGETSSSSPEEIGRGSTRSEDPQDAVTEESRQIVIRSKDKPVTRQQIRKPNQQSSRPDLLMVAPNAAPVFSSAVISSFRNALLPPNILLPSKDYGSSLLVTPCSPWITYAYDTALAQNKSALKSGLLAIGLILYGLENSSRNLKVASYQMHRQALSQLRNELVPITLNSGNKQPATQVVTSYLSCLAIAMFEMIQSGFSPVILQHVKALNSLIELMYADPNIDRFTVDLIMEDFGMLEMVFCIKFGFISILRHTRRRLGLKRPGKGNAGKFGRNASVYGDILDIIEELPVLMSQIKNLKEKSCFETSSEDLQKISRKLLRMQEDLISWNIEFEIRHGPVMKQESFSEGSNGDRGTMPRLTGYEHGAVGLFVLNFELYALDANVEAMSTLLLMKQDQGTYSQPTELSPVKKFDPEYEVCGISASSIQYLDTSSIAASTDGTMLNYRRLHEQIKAQRARARLVTKDLLELVIQFSGLALNLTGQALLVLPCEMIGKTLNQEHFRLNEDLHNTPPGDTDGIIKIHKEIAHLAGIRQVFEGVERRMQRQDFGAM